MSSAWNLTTNLQTSNLKPEEIHLPDLDEKIKNWIRHWGQSELETNVKIIRKWIGSVDPYTIYNYNFLKDLSSNKGFKTEFEQNKSAQSPHPVETGSVRLMFIKQMLISPIFYPFANDEFLVSLARQPNHLGKVLVTIDTSNSGSLRFVLCKRVQGFPIWASESVEKILYNRFLHGPAAVRIYVFRNFQGVICSYNSELFSGNKIKPKWLEIQGSLDKEERDIMEGIFRNAIQFKRIPGPNEMRTLNEMRGLAIGMQSVGLNQEDLYWFERIMNIEMYLDGGALTPEVVQELTRLFEVNRLEKTFQEAEQFQILALCSAGEYIDHLRAKFKVVYPQFAVEDIAKLTKQTICKALLNDFAVENISFSTSIFDLKDVPKHLINPRTGLLNAKQVENRDAIEYFLISRYGIKFDDFIKQNDIYLKDLEINPEKYKYIVQEQEIDHEHQAQIQGRLMLSEPSEHRCDSVDPSKCTQSFKLGNVSLCQLDQQTDTCQNVPLTVQVVFRGIFSSYCYPKLPLFRNDINFIRIAYDLLYRFKVRRDTRARGMLNRIDQMCLFNKVEWEFCIKYMKEQSLNNSIMDNTVPDIELRETPFKNEVIETIQSNGDVVEIISHIVYFLVYKALEFQIIQR